MADQTSSVPGYDFIRFVLEALVDDKNDLNIDGRIDELGVLITVQVSDNDMGKLIGKGGQTVKALRTLLRMLGSNLHQRINLKILEPEGSGSPSSSPSSHAA